VDALSVTNLYDAQLADALSVPQPETHAVTPVNALLHMSSVDGVYEADGVSLKPLPGTLRRTQTVFESQMLEFHRASTGSSDGPPPLSRTPPPDCF